MRKGLVNVPLQITLGRVPAELADEFRENGDAISIKGHALLLQSSAGLERLLGALDINPAITELIVRAARLVEATSDSHPHTSPQHPKATDVIVSRIALEACAQDLDLDPQAAADVVRTITRAQQAVIARKAASEAGPALSNIVSGGQ